MHSSKAALAQPERAVDVDDDESSDAVHQPGGGQQGLPERHAAGQGRGGEDPWPVLHPVAEGRENEHADRDSEKGEFRVTLPSRADQSRINSSTRIVSRSTYQAWRPFAKASRNAHGSTTNRLRGVRTLLSRRCESEP